jgi:hypothetical protein
VSQRYLAIPLIDVLRPHSQHPMHTKLYRNDQIVTVMCNSFFVRGSLAFAHCYDHKFPRYRGPDGVVVLVHEVPKPMVALVATTVRVTYQYRHHTNQKSQLYAAIHEWRAGVQQHQKNVIALEPLILLEKCSLETSWKF